MRDDEETQPKSRFDPTVSLGHLLVAASMLVSVATYVFAPRAAPELNAQAIKTNAELIKLAREEDAKQDRFVAEFRAEVIRQLTLQTDALQKLNSNIVELNVRMANIERRVEGIEKSQGIKR